MEISVKLPESLYQNISQLAEVKKKSVAELIKSAVRKAVIEDSVDFEELSKIIEQSIKFCTNKEVLSLAVLQTPANQRLNYLFEKNRESVLNKKEKVELTKAVELSRINDLRKAFGIIEAKKRGLIK